MDSIKKYPNLYVIGVAKAGTTALATSLSQHPKIAFPDGNRLKEPSFFAEGKNQGILSEAEYLQIYSNINKPGAKYLGDASTAYSKELGVAKKIAEKSPEAKVIMVLRNPIDRAYSLYNWMVQNGYEYISTFEKALKKEEKRIHKSIPNFWEPEYKPNYLYVESGRYAAVIKEFQAHFGNLHFIKYDDLLSDYSKQLYQTFEFLELSIVEIPGQKKTNKSYSVWHPAISFIIRKGTGILGLMLNYRLLYPIQSKALRWVMRKKAPKKLNSSIRNQLKTKFENDIIETMELTGLDLNNWLN